MGGPGGGSCARRLGRTAHLHRSLIPRRAHPEDVIGLIHDPATCAYCASVVAEGSWRERLAEADRIREAESHPEDAPEAAGQPYEEAVNLCAQSLVEAWNSLVKTVRAGREAFTLLGEALDAPADDKPPQPCPIHPFGFGDADDAPAGLCTCV